MMHFEENQLSADSSSSSPKDASAGEDHEDMDVHMDFSTDEVSEPDHDSRSSSLERTTSQVAAQVQVQGVLQRLEERKGQVQQLGQSVAALATEGGVNVLQDSARQLDIIQKAARNLGEDLLEDMLALDKLSGLIAEDRSNRKAAIAGIEALLEDVDKHKSRLPSLRKIVQAALDSEMQQQQHDSNVRDHVLGPQRLEEPTPPPAPQVYKASQAHPKSHQPCRQDSVQQQQPLLMVPDCAMWGDLNLPVDFQSRQDRGSYVIAAAVPNLNQEELEIGLTDDRSALTITGLCMPTSRQAEQMHQQAIVELQRLAAASPLNFQQLRNQLNKVAAGVYTKIGEGRFGRFSETFQLPADVDAERIRAGVEDGVLRVVLPRKVHREIHPMTTRHPLGHRHNSRHWRHPAFGW